MRVTQKRALVRPPSAAFRRCMSTHPLRDTVNIELAREQHDRYVKTLCDLGVDVMKLEPDPTLPDACFVEDTAVVRGGRALLTRPRPVSRRAEVSEVGRALEEYLECKSAEPPATIEGGDVIHLSDRLIVGLSERTNIEGIRQLSEWLRVRVDIIVDPKMMHLKSHLTAIDDDLFVGTERFRNESAVRGSRYIVVPPEESYAANTLTINRTVILPTGHPDTLRMIRDWHLDVITIDMSEFQKCDGALTCLSILF